MESLSEYRTFDLNPTIRINPSIILWTCNLLHGSCHCVQDIVEMVYSTVKYCLPYKSGI